MDIRFDGAFMELVTDYEDGSIRRWPKNPADSLIRTWKDIPIETHNIGRPRMREHQKKFLNLYLKVEKKKTIKTMTIAKIHVWR